jgi:hypothetical protein
MPRSWSIWKLWREISSAGISESLTNRLAGSSTHKFKSCRWPLTNSSSEQLGVITWKQRHLATKTWQASSNVSSKIICLGDLTSFPSFLNIEFLRFFRRSSQMMCLHISLLTWRPLLLSCSYFQPGYVTSYSKSDMANRSWNPKARLLSHMNRITCRKGKWLSQIG